MSDNCFVCGKKLGKNPRRVDTHEDQFPSVGVECYKIVKAAGAAGYQPPLGGPRVWVITEDRLQRLMELTRDRNLDWEGK